MHRGKCVVPIRVVVLLVVDEEIGVISKISRKIRKSRFSKFRNFRNFRKIFLKNIFFDSVGHIKTGIAELVGVSLEC